MVTGEQLFRDDLTTFSYSTTRLFPSLSWPTAPDPYLPDYPFHPLEMLLAVMLNIDPQMRPNAPDVHRVLEMIQPGTNSVAGFPRPCNVGNHDQAPVLINPDLTPVQVFDSSPLQMN